MVPMRNWRHWLLFAAVWAVLAGLGAAEAYLGFMISEKDVPLLGLARRQLESWGAWGLVAVGILAYAQFLQSRVRSLSWWVVAHMAGAAIACTAYATVYASLVHGQPSILEPIELRFRKVFTITLAHSAVFGLIIYWATVGVFHGIGIYRRLRDREHRARDLERQLTQAHLDSLRAQLHPHFLFNTLHTISSLIHSRPDTADRIVVRLSELLRASLDQSAHHEITLREELAFLDRYLEIEQARFGDRLMVERQFEPETADALVPALILQPLVENAVRHGIEPRAAAGRIVIRARRFGETLELAVHDNGPGIDTQATGPRRQGIGLSNTRSRLNQLYGEAQAFELNAPASGGLEARITLPFRHARQQPTNA